MSAVPPSAMLFLVLAIASEIVATTSLKLSQGFTRPLPSVLVVVGYGAAFYLVSLSLKYIPLGTVYAIWSGVGTAVIAVVGVALFKESMDAVRLGGIALIVAGVVALNLARSG